MRALAGATLVMPEALSAAGDPTRLRLLWSAQRAGHTITPAIEVESPASALEIAARGVADTVVTYTLAHSLGLLDRLSHAPLDPALVENFGFIRRRGGDLSPGAAVLVELTRMLLTGLPETDPEGGNRRQR